MLNAFLHVVLNINVCWQVCTHHAIMIKIHSSVFFIFYLQSLPLSQIELILEACLWHHTDPGPSHDCLIDSSVSAQTGLVSYLRPALRELSSVRHCFDAGAQDADKNDS